ncbi:hypothetical protein Q9323_14980 [Pseudomonas fulva]|uniref:hypothetical protein n=1 Tax=Pseudomonas fulva TaxID=47880 RepID=UPI0031F624DD
MFKHPTAYVQSFIIDAPQARQGAYEYISGQEFLGVDADTVLYRAKQEFAQEQMVMALSYQGILGKVRGTANNYPGNTTDYSQNPRETAMQAGHKLFGS